jgi:CRP/FNR family transcriptional regulator, anaerobic regulatory protein
LGTAKMPRWLKVRNISTFAYFRNWKNLYDKMRQILTKLGLQEEDIIQMESILTDNIHFESGQYFLKEGKMAKGIGFITKGAFRYFYNCEGEEVTRWVSLEGDFVTSLSSYIDNKPTNENIIAMKESEILFATKEKWEALFNKNEKLRQFWLKNIEEMYVGMENRVYQLIALKAEQRYKWMCTHQPQFIAEVPDKYLASMLGITPRHLTRLRKNK